MTIQQLVPGGRLTQGFGMTDYAKTGAYGGGPHTGLDIGAPYNTPIYWPEPMKSVYRGWDPGGYGNFVLGTTFSGKQILFGHMTSFGSGNVAGYVGSTGNSTGFHTHFEVRAGGRAIDPVPYLNEVNSNTGEDVNTKILAIQGQIFRITGNWHSIEDIIKNHLNKTDVEIDDTFYRKEPKEREIAIRGAGEAMWRRAFNEPYPEEKVAIHMGTRKDYQTILGEISADVIETLKKRNTGFQDTNSMLDKIASFVLGLKRT